MRHNDLKRRVGGVVLVVVAVHTLHSGKLLSECIGLLGFVILAVLF